MTSFEGIQRVGNAQNVDILVMKGALKHILEKNVVGIKQLE